MLYMIISTSQTPKLTIRHKKSIFTERGQGRKGGGRERENNILIYYGIKEVSQAYIGNIQ